MDAEKLKQKKHIGRKGKIKKTIKNVICPPDTVLWPVLKDSENFLLKSVLENYRVRIPKLLKPPWKELQLIPKNERPKLPSVKRVNGLLFGIMECHAALQREQCSAVLIEATVNPRTIVQPMINKCLSSNTPILCMDNLKTLTKTFFGIKTSCLGVKYNSLLDVSSKIKELFQQYKTKTRPINIIYGEDTQKEKVTKMDVDENIATIYPYLIRSNKQTRVFDPSCNRISSKEGNKFSGQHYIKVLNNDINSDQTMESDRTAYMRMILKKISNNPNRVKIN